MSWPTLLSTPLWVLVSVGAQLIHAAITLHYWRRCRTTERYVRDLAKRLRAMSFWAKHTQVAPAMHAPRRESVHDRATVSILPPSERLPGE